MPSDMIREIWAGLKRFWRVRWAIKVPILAFVVLVLGFLAVVVVVIATIGSHPNLGTAVRYEQSAEELLRAGKEGAAAENFAMAGDIYLEIGLFTDAAEAYSSVLRLRPPEAGTYNLRGYAYLNLGSYALAEADFGRAIDLEPEFLAAYVNRGLARAMLGDADGAIADFDRELSLSTDPDSDTSSLLYELDELRSHSRDPDVSAAIRTITKHLKSR